MKLIIILFTLIALSSCDSDDDKLVTLKVTFEEQKNQFDDFGPESATLRQARHACMKEKLKYAANSEKLLTKFQWSNAVLFANILCGEDLVDETPSLMNKYVKEASKLSSAAKVTHINCSKKILKQLNPNSDLVKDFNVNVLTANDEKECAKMSAKYEEDNERGTMIKLGIEDCIDVYSKQSTIHHVIVNILASTEPKNDAALAAEREYYKKKSRTETEAIVACIIKNVK